MTKSPNIFLSSEISPSSQSHNNKILLTCRSVDKRNAMIYLKQTQIIMSAILEGLTGT